jgi:hypothetical protein
MQRDRCRAVVYRRNTYRRKRGVGFKLHFAKGRCKRVRSRYDLCTQHANIERQGTHVPRTEW